MYWPWELKDEFQTWAKKFFVKPFFFLAIYYHSNRPSAFKSPHSFKQTQAAVLVHVRRKDRRHIMTIYKDIRTSNFLSSRDAKNKRSLICNVCTPYTDCTRYFHHTFAPNKPNHPQRVGVEKSNPCFHEPRGKKTRIPLHCIALAWHWVKIP